MADNVEITPGTGAVVAADEIAGVMHQRVKMQFGADGEATDVSSADPMPVDVPGVSTEATLSALKASVDALSAKVSACNTDAVALDAATLAALETVTIANPTAQGLTNTQLRDSPVPVSGDFYQATQPVSASALPLPAGAATEATISAANDKLPALEGGRIPVVLPAGGGGLTNAELRDSPLPVADDTVGGLLRRMLALLMSPRGYDKSMARQRVTASIENLPTLAAVTTVSTVNNLAQVAGRDAVMLINPTNRTSWALNHRSRIT